MTQAPFVVTFYPGLTFLTFLSATFSSSKDSYSIPSMTFFKFATSSSVKVTPFPIFS